MSRRIINLIFSFACPRPTPTEERLARYARTDKIGSEPALSWSPEQLRIMGRANRKAVRT